MIRTLERILRWRSSPPLGPSGGCLGRRDSPSLGPSERCVGWRDPPSVSLLERYSGRRGSPIVPPSLALVLSTALFLGCTAEGAQPPTHEPANRQLSALEVQLSEEAIEWAGIEIAPAELRSIRVSNSIPAEVMLEPGGAAHVAPLVRGRVSKIHVTVGEEVRKGQLLGEVQSSDASSARSGLDQARARLLAARSALERQEQLSREGIGSQRSLVEAQALAGVLEAEVAGLRRQLAVLGSGKEGTVALSSPIDGVVVSIESALGETATADASIFTVTDPERTWIRANVSELDLEKVRQGAPALVRLYAFPGLALSGKVVYVAPTLDERSRTLPLRVQLDAPDPRLRGGLFGSVELLHDGDGRTVAVPAEAIAKLERQAVVFVPSSTPGSFRAKPVAVGPRAGGFIEIREGLEAGEPVVVKGSFTLKSILWAEDLGEGHVH